VKGFFVAGTDTGVGKTEIARAICLSLARKGMQPVALKPVETGCDPERPLDALALREACGSSQPLDDVCPYRFRLPAAPLVAAGPGRASTCCASSRSSIARGRPCGRVGGWPDGPAGARALSLDQAGSADRAPAQAIVATWTSRTGCTFRCAGGARCPGDPESLRPERQSAGTAGVAHRRGGVEPDRAGGRPERRHQRALGDRDDRAQVLSPGPLWPIPRASAVLSHRRRLFSDGRAVERVDSPARPRFRAR
jgi:hypothetical protein